MGRYTLKSGFTIGTIQDLCIVLGEKMMLPEYIQKGGKYEDLVESFIPYMYYDKSDTPICFIPDDRVVSKNDLKDVLPYVFESEQDLKEYLKRYDTGTLELFLKALIGIDNVSKNYYYYCCYRSYLVSKFIRYYFPHKNKLKGAKQRVTKYPQFSTLDLKRICRRNKIKFKITEHPGIQRMYLVTALQDAGILDENDIMVGLRKDIADYTRTPEKIIADRQMRKKQEEDDILRAICQSLYTDEDLKSEENFGKIELSPVENEFEDCE